VFEKPVVWERLKVAPRVVVFSRPSPPYSKRGFLNEDGPRERFSAGRDSLPSILEMEFDLWVDAVGPIQFPASESLEFRFELRATTPTALRTL